MPDVFYYFKRFDNKIPCGGFYQMGGNVKNKYIESEKFNSMFAKKWGNYHRCICMNFDDYSTITTDINNGIYKTYYDVRFFPMDFLDELQFSAGLKKAMEWVEEHGAGEADEYALYKTFVPVAFNGKPMDLYDVIDLYVNNLGLKTVPSSDNERITDSNTCAAYILKYYESDATNFSNFIKNSTMVYSPGGYIGDIATDIKIYGAEGSIRFISEGLEEYGKYKNVLETFPKE